MELVKPDPLIIGGRAHYTLRSYDPVTVEVEVPYLTEEEVDYALAMTLMQAGGRPEDSENDAWIAEHFEGAHNVEDVREAIKAQLSAMNAQMAEQRKAELCVEQLAKRLMQRVPDGDVARTRSGLAQAFAMSLAQDGMSEAEFFAESGMTSRDLEAMFDAQAKSAAEQEAAVDAWAENRKMTVSDEELPQLLGLPAENSEQFMSQLRIAGQLEQARAAALRAKALNALVAECSCSYKHETPEAAHERVAASMDQLRAEIEAVAAPQQQNDHPHLKLV